MQEEIETISLQNEDTKISSKRSTEHENVYGDEETKETSFVVASDAVTQKETHNLEKDAPLPITKQHNGQKPPTSPQLVRVDEIKLFHTPSRTQVTHLSWVPAVPIDCNICYLIAWEAWKVSSSLRGCVVLPSPR